MTSFAEPKVIYQEANPYGTFTAYLEDDGRTVYLYLQAEQNPEFGIRSVWVCNRTEAPEKEVLRIFLTAWLRFFFALK